MTAPNDVPNAADVSDATLAEDSAFLFHIAGIEEGDGHALTARRMRVISERLDALLAQRAADAGEIERLRAVERAARAYVISFNCDGMAAVGSSFLALRAALAPAPAATEAPCPASRYPVLSAEEAAAEQARLDGRAASEAGR